MKTISARRSVPVTAMAALAMSLLVLQGCSCDELFGFFNEPAADVGSPLQATVGGVSFNYPGNWKLTTSVVNENGVNVEMAEIESAGSSYVMVQVFNQPIPLDGELDTLLSQGLMAMKSAVNDMSAGLMGASGMDAIQPLTRNMLGAMRNGRQAVVQYTVLNEPLPYRMEIVAATLADRSVLVMFGIAQEDWGSASPGYDQVIDTMVVTGPVFSGGSPILPAPAQVQ